MLVFKPYFQLSVVLRLYLSIFCTSVGNVKYTESIIY